MVTRKNLEARRARAASVRDKRSADPSPAFVLGRNEKVGVVAWVIVGLIVTGVTILWPRFNQPRSQTYAVPANVLTESATLPAGSRLRGDVMTVQLDSADHEIFLRIARALETIARKK